MNSVAMRIAAIRYMEQKAEMEKKASKEDKEFLRRMDESIEVKMVQKSN